MSTESVRARLDAATSGRWYRISKARANEGRIVVIGDYAIDPNWNDADLIAHAPTDLRLALDVIEAAKAHAALERGGCTLGAASSSLSRLESTLAAFEATP